jgi:protein-S-isoprenylcysteine O-methyltransferase Ste14
MGRSLILGYGVLAYTVFLVAFLYLIAFLADAPHTALGESLPWLATLVPHTVDAGRSTGAPWLAALIDTALILLFGVQHSVMARLGFKAWLKRHLPASAERSTYVLLTSLCLALLFWQWRPLPTVVWAADSSLGIAFGWGVFGAGFALVLVATFLIDHFDLFGLKQVWRGFTRGADPAPRFVTPWLYRFVRHPLYLGWFLAFLGTPVMTVGHLLFSGLMCAYILVAVRWEERDLVREHGARYARYRAEVPMLVPVPGRSYSA